MAENRMELFIETLTGTAFELSCSPLETIVSIKAKIQYSEGIPVSQQHLIWKSQELNDDLCLQDYCITDGATLKLVLGMRGGPINTRQVSDNKKIKDLADYVERRSETSGSGGRPFTVLVFHDGDKVHMYTLMERGECSVSPLSGTISEASSVASIKNVEELDQELIKENEITREKIAQLQEQIKALNINRSKKIASANQMKEGNGQTKQPEDYNEDFHLPPLQRIDSFDSEALQYSYSDARYKVKPLEKSCFSHFAPDVGSIAASLGSSPDADQIDQKSCKSGKNFHNSANKRDDNRTSAALDCISDTISTHLITPPDADASEPVDEPCSNFLPYIHPTHQTSNFNKKAFPGLHAQNAQCIGVSLSSTCVDSIIKCDPSRMKKTHKHLPLTSSQALSSQRFLDLDHWMQNRPKTTPEESMCRSVLDGEPLCKSKFNREDRGKRRSKRNVKNSPSIGLASGEKSSLMMQTFTNHRDVAYDIIPSLVYKNKSVYSQSHSKTGTGTVTTAGMKPLKQYSPSQTEVQESVPSKVKNTKVTSRINEEASRPHSGRKLPLIKAKKKSYKRCSLCSKKTGLATSYTCRCGKNFCATHRYAEVHHCSYDYKTEGRRMLQLNNPVVAASKLPKI